MKQNNEFIEFIDAQELPDGMFFGPRTATLEIMLKDLANIARVGTRFDTGHDSDWANDHTAEDCQHIRRRIKTCKKALKEARAKVLNWHDGRTRLGKAEKARKAHTLALLEQRIAIVKMAEAQIRLHGHSGTDTNVERWTRAAFLMHNV